MTLFPIAPGPRDPVVGLGASVAVAEALGTALDTKVSRAGVFIRGRRAGKVPNAVMETAARRVCRGSVDGLAQVLAALGSGHRLRILAHLLEGPATYKSLQRQSRLQAGPLYHHINQLRLAGLVGPKSRDTYALTRAGRNALLVMLSLRPLLKDARPRPLSRAATT